MAGRGFGRWGKRHPEGQWTVDRPGVTLALGAMSWKAAGDPDSEGEARRRGVMGLHPGLAFVSMRRWVTEWARLLVGTFRWRFGFSSLLSVS